MLSRFSLMSFTHTLHDPSVLILPFYYLAKIDARKIPEKPLKFSALERKIVFHHFLSFFSVISGEKEETANSGDAERSESFA